MFLYNTRFTLFRPFILHTLDSLQQLRKKQYDTISSKPLILTQNVHTLNRHSNNDDLQIIELSNDRAMYDPNNLKDRALVAEILTANPTLQHSFLNNSSKEFPDNLAGLYTESVEAYEKRSLQDIAALLQPHMLYILITRASTGSGPFPGHIASGITDSNAKIINDSFISIRKDARAHTKYKLQYALPNRTDTIDYQGEDDANRTQYREKVKLIKFANAEEEFHNYFVGNKSLLAPESEAKTFLIGIPLKTLQMRLGYTADHLLKLAQNTQRKYTNNYYILANGELSETIESVAISVGKVTAKNCVNGFYDALGLQSVARNPSPQMAAWSFIEWIFGPMPLLDDIGLRNSTVERVFNDKLSVYQQPESTYRMKMR